MRFEEIAEVVRGIPYMRHDQGRRIYEHVLTQRPAEILEIGTAHGVSAAYMAAALDAIGTGHLTTIDSVRAARYYRPESLLDRPGIGQRVTQVRIEDSSYTWWLKNLVERRSDGAGNCQPLYDFCYLDGAHDWTIDGLATVLVEKLLNPGAWLLLDDLDWTHAAGMTEKDERLSTAERNEPHMRMVFDLLVKQHPSFTELRIEDDEWGWALKAPDQPRRLSLETARSPTAYVVIAARRTLQRARVMRSERRRRSE